MTARRLVLAVDIGATKTLLTVRTTDELAAGWPEGGPSARTTTLTDPEHLVGWIGDKAERLASHLAGSIVTTGVAAPGPLDAARGVVTRSPNLEWLDVPIGPLLRERLGVPTALEDDAKAAALGEWRYGAGHGADPFAYLTISSGVGGGIVAGGEVLHGATGNAGEVGHLVLDPTGPCCACGRRGDIESFAGGASLARRARKAWPERTLPDGTPAPRDAAAVFRLARRHDRVALKLVEEATDAMAAGFAAIAAVVEPRRLAVGGSIGLGQRRTVRRAASWARRRILEETGRTLDVVPAALGDESVLAGVATIAQRAIEPKV